MYVMYNVVIGSNIEVLIPPPPPQISSTKRPLKINIALHKKQWGLICYKTLIKIKKKHCAHLLM